MGGGSSTSTTSNTSLVSTNTVTDSYNESFSRIENLSDVGNVAINMGGIPGQDSGVSVSPLVLLIIGAVAVAIVWLKK